MAGKESKPKPHAIIIPLPYQGHINPLLHLALNLASNGVRVTFVHLEFIHLRLADAHRSAACRGGDGGGFDIFAEARQSGLDIRYETIGDDFPLEFDRDLHFPTYWDFLVRRFGDRVDEFVGKAIARDRASAHFVVADCISVWAAAVAEKYNLVHVAVWTQAAFTFCLGYHWELLRDKGHLSTKQENNEAGAEIDYIPGVPSINTKDLMKYLDPENVVAAGMSTGLKNTKKADFILHNTVQELEPHALSTLNNLYQPSYAVGPTSFYPNLPVTTVTKSFWPEFDCTGWLASRPAGSVLYVSFGSIVQTSEHVIHEVAHGLSSSGASFIWVVREGILLGSGGGGGMANVLPVGFEDETEGKGLIVPWCDQVGVLSNPAVGGFLTHCGWNSTLESMWCGVPMMCCPLEFDQPTVAKLVVDHWGVGMRLCERGRRVDRDEIGERIRGFMCGSIGRGLREEALRVKGVFRSALAAGGSTQRNFDRFIDDLKEKIESRSSG